MLEYCNKSFKGEVPSVCIFLAKFTACSDLRSQKIILIGVVFMGKDSNKWGWFCRVFPPVFILSFDYNKRSRSKVSRVSPWQMVPLPLSL